MTALHAEPAMLVHLPARPLTLDAYFGHRTELLEDLLAAAPSVLD